MNWRPHYETTEDMDLGSLGGTLKAGALIRPMTGNFEGNVALLTFDSWVDRIEGSMPIIGGWPEAVEGKVVEAKSPSQESFERMEATHVWPVMPITWFDGGRLVKTCPRCHHSLNFWGGHVPEGERWGECRENDGGCGAFWDIDEGVRTSSLGPCEHKTMTVKCNQVSTLVVLRELPEDHGYPDEEAWLTRYLCACGVKVDLLVPEPTWEVPSV